MALRKDPRSCQTPAGWGLATVEEAKDNLERIKQSDLLGEWDTARLLNGWIGGSAYDFKLEEAFKSCLGYMLLIESTTPEISNTDDRNAALYSEVPKLSEEGRSAAFLLCSQDWNEEVLKWLMPGDTEEDRARQNAMSLWEGDRTKAASEVVSAVARECQGFHSKLARVPIRMESPLASLEALMDWFSEIIKCWAVNAQESLKALKIGIQEADGGKTANDILKYFLKGFAIMGDEILLRIRGISNVSEEFEDFRFDTSETSTWEAFADTVCNVSMETVCPFNVTLLCDQLCKEVDGMHSEADDDCPTLASLIQYAYLICDNLVGGMGTVVVEAAERANGDRKRFGEILRDKGTSLLSNCTGEFDASSAILALAANNGDLNMVKWLIKNGVNPSKTD